MNLHRNLIIIYNYHVCEYPVEAFRSVKCNRQVKSILSAMNKFTEIPVYIEDDARNDSMYLSINLLQFKNIRPY